MTPGPKSLARGGLFCCSTLFLKGLLGQTHILMEKHFFIWSHLSCVCKGLCLNGPNGPRPRAQMNGPNGPGPRAQMNGPNRAQMNGPNRAQQMNGPNRAQQMNGPNRAQMNGPNKAQQNISHKKGLLSE